MRARREVGEAVWKRLGGLMGWKCRPRSISRGGQSKKLHDICADSTASRFQELLCYTLAFFLDSDIPSDSHPLRLHHRSLTWHHCASSQHIAVSDSQYPSSLRLNTHDACKLFERSYSSLAETKAIVAHTEQRELPLSSRRRRSPRQ